MIKKIYYFFSPLNLFLSNSSLDSLFEMITAKEVTLLNQQSIPDAQIDVKDLGGGDHLEVNVVSAKFSGLSLVQQHQLVYGALKNELKTETIHALALKTSTPH